MIARARAATLGLTTTMAMVMAMALAVGTAGCKGTYLEVRFAGAGLTGVTAIRLTLTLTPPSGPTVHSSDRVSRAGGKEITFPTSMALSLNEEAGMLRIDAEALSATDVVLATGFTETTIHHGKTWGVDIDFSGGSSADGGVADAAANFVVLDGSIADGQVGCVSGTLYAIDSVSIDYNNSGPMMGSGNFLWARAAAQQDFVGWMKFTFNVRDLPGPGMRSPLELTSATLNLTAATVAGAQPRLQVQYSTFDGWTGAPPGPSASQLVATHPLSEVIDTVQTGLNRFPLFVTTDRHDWKADLVDGQITLGIDNVSPDSALASNVEFYGVDRGSGQPLVRPSLDVTICRR